MVNKRSQSDIPFLTATVIGGVILGLLSLLGLHFGKRWVKREIARAFKTFQPFQPTSYPYVAHEGLNGDDHSEG